MSEFEVNGIRYKGGKLNAMTQLHVSQRLAPLIASLTEVLQDGSLDAKKISAVLIESVSKLSDANSEYVIYTCLNVVTRDQGGDRGYSPVLASDRKTIMFPDIDSNMITMLTIAAHVLQDNLSGFFPSNVLAFGGDGTAPTSNG